jgi:flavin-dependent dehydrogenase
MKESSIHQDLAEPGRDKSSFQLEDGARVAAIGGGPAGSFFCKIHHEHADRFCRENGVVIYEPRNYSGVGPASCNMCGGIISETLVQNLAAEGINLPADVVQRGVDSYMLHMDVGDTKIETPLNEMRIGTVYRATGPRDLKESKWRSFDGFLLGLAQERGARLVASRVASIVQDDDGRPVITAKDGTTDTFDLLVVASGVNAQSHKLFEGTALDYEPPETTKTFIREFFLGVDTINEHVGSSMHVFLLNLPGLEFAAIIPKGDYVSVCLLGDGIDKGTLATFLESPEVRRCMPPGWEAKSISCQCSPKMNIGAATAPFADRIVFIGDCGVTRLYKDGIGAAYRTAKAAASTAVFEGVSKENFEKHFWPVCRSIDGDNSIGKFLFKFTEYIQKYPFARRAIRRMVAEEQKKGGPERRMSMVLWDLFTGSATYRNILKRTLHPVFIARLAGNVAIAVVSPSGGPRVKSTGETSQ